ncbi:MAG: hypothetical protein QOH88_388 [Verrucomicrobiota bacterium]
MRLFAIILFASAAFCQAAESASGRWEGSAQIPGAELKLIVDLSEESEKGMIGSIIIPGYGVKGAQLVDLHVRGGELAFAIKGALGSERAGQAELHAHLSTDGHLAGEFRQGGNRAPFVLEKTGPAQVELPLRNTPVSKELEGEWKGEYELNGYARHVTMKFSNRGAEGAGLEFVIVGKKTNNVPVTLVTQEEDFLTIKSDDFGMTYEGRFPKGAAEIKGMLTQGPFEVPLVMRRAP